MSTRLPAATYRAREPASSGWGGSGSGKRLTRVRDLRASRRPIAETVRTGSSVDRRSGADFCGADPTSRDPSGFGERFRTHTKQTCCASAVACSVATAPPRTLVREVFLRARRAYDRYDPVRPFRPWLLSIAGHHCIDQLRRRATEKRVFQDGEPSDADLHRSPCAGHQRSSPLSRAVAAQERGAISRAIESLPLKYRLPIVLRYFSDYDYAAIAAALDVTPNQVGSLLFRAKRLLRERLREPERYGDSS